MKHVTIKKDKTGAWYACLNVERGTPENPATTGINAKNSVGIDLGIKKFIHDSDRRQINRLDLSVDRERLEREQQARTRKEDGSSNWEQQRQKVAEVRKRMRNKKRISSTR